MVRERQRTCGSSNRMFSPYSLLFRGIWYATGGEREVLRTSCSLSCVAGNDMRHAGRNGVYIPRLHKPIPILNKCPIVHSGISVDFEHISPLATALRIVLYFAFSC